VAPKKFRAQGSACHHGPRYNQRGLIGILCAGSTVIIIDLSGVKRFVDRQKEFPAPATAGRENTVEELAKEIKLSAN